METPFAIIDFLTFRGEIKAATPTTTNKLKIFDPTTLPTVISLAPANAPVILTAASGALVPNATMVNPIIKLGIFKVLAIDDAPSTNKSAPLIKKMNPMTNKI